MSFDGLADITVAVRRRLEEDKLAIFRLRDVDALRRDAASGVNIRGPRAFLRGYVRCIDLIDGVLEHDCGGDDGPHRVAICLTKEDNPKQWRLVLQRFEDEKWSPRLSGPSKPIRDR